MPEIVGAIAATTVHKCLELPDWLPASVGECARRLWIALDRQTAASEVGMLLHRLASDPRMRKVWNELQKRKRENYQPTENFVHPAMPIEYWFPYLRYARDHPAQGRERGAPPFEILVNYQNLVLGTLYPGETQQERAMSYFFS